MGMSTAMFFLVAVVCLFSVDLARTYSHLYDLCNF